MTERTFTTLDALDMMWMLAGRGTCPRCGIPGTMRRPLEANALSRHTRGENDAPLYVCSPCGTAEGLEDYAGALQPLGSWANPPTSERREDQGGSTT